MILAAATAVSLHRGGAVSCKSLVDSLARALAPYAEMAPPSRIADIAQLAANLVQAVEVGDVPEFDAVREQMSRQLAYYWSSVVRHDVAGA